MIRAIRLAARTLRRQPGFTALTVVMLALGLGVTTAIFSLMNALLFRPMPYPQADGLVRIYRTVGREGGFPHSVPNFQDTREQASQLEGMAAFVWRAFSLSEPGNSPERMQGMFVTAGFFDLLRVQPRLGRAFLPEEDQDRRNQVVILSDELWRGRFAADPGVVGRKLRLDGETVTVVGVMAPQFSYPMVWGPVDLLRPAGFSRSKSEDRSRHSIEVIGRLKPGVTIGQAQGEMSAIAARLDQLHGTRSGLRLVPLHQSGMNEAGTRMSWMTMGLAMFVLLIVCINLAGVQLARLAGRGHEHAIRVALGASGGRLVAQLLTESLLLSVAGGALGLLVADWCTGLLSRFIQIGASSAALRMPMDGRVIGFALAMVLVAALVVGTVPAWLSVRRAVADGLRSGGRGTTDHSRPRLRQALVVAQMALALVLLTAGGVVAGGLRSYLARDPGWQVDGLLVGRLTLPAAPYRSDEPRVAFIERLQAELAGLAGVEHVAVSWSVPTRGFSANSAFMVEGTAPAPAGTEPYRYINGVTPDYFRTLGIPLHEGRTFTTGDSAGAPAVAVINEAMARRFWPGQSALHKRIGNTQGDPEWKTIVGVVGDVAFPANPAAPLTRFQVYHPLVQGTQYSTYIAVRGQRPTEQLARDLRAAVARVDPEIPLYLVRTARQLIDEAVANFALVGWILCAFSLLGLLLAAVGVYGLFSGFVVQRTREIGVRVALGAGTGRVVWLVLGKGLRLALLGAVLGVAGALGLGPVLTAVAAELPAHGPVSLVLLPLVLVGVALLACWLPARRAAALDPMVALRQD